jgi:hypothetical protein
MISTGRMQEIFDKLDSFSKLELTQAEIIERRNYLSGLSLEEKDFTKRWALFFKEKIKEKGYASEIEQKDFLYSISLEKQIQDRNHKIDLILKRN